MTDRYLAVPLKPKSGFNTVKGAVQVLQDLQNYHNELAKRLATASKGYLKDIQSDKFFQIFDRESESDEEDGDEDMDVD